MKKQSAKGIWTGNMRKTVACLMLLLPLGFFNSCSDGGDDGGDPPPPSGTFSVPIAGPNQNMPSGGIVTSQYSDHPSGSDIGKALDNDITTKFVTSHSSFYILWTGSVSAAVSDYSITSGDGDAENDPKSWKLSGSNNNTTWTLIDEQTNQTFSARQETKDYTTLNKILYRYYKLEILSNNGGSATHIAEWTMQLPITIDDLMVYANGKTYTSATPMGTHYANRHQTTEADRVWLQTASNEPSIPSSTSGLRYSPCTVNLFPYGKPLPADVNQHAIGDCGGLAAMASMAYQYPDFVKGLITDNGDNTYTVAMFDPKGNAVDVTVSNKFLVGGSGNIEAVSGKNNTATWATVLEKAIMKWNMIYQANPDIGGIGSEHVPPLFTGNGTSFAFSPGSLSPEQMARVTRVCLIQGKFVIGGFNPAGKKIGNLETVGAHAYTMMHSTDDKALFAMRNPWGWSPGEASHEKLDGVLNIPSTGEVPATVDFRIIDPGIAGTKGTKEPYIPPVYSASPSDMRVSAELMMTYRQ